MSDDITYLRTMTTHAIPVERVINGLVEDKDDFKSILVIGFNQDDRLESRSSGGDVGELLELLEMFKFNLLSGNYER